MPDSAMRGSEVYEDCTSFQALSEVALDSGIIIIIVTIIMIIIIIIDITFFRDNSLMSLSPMTRVSY